MSPSTRRRLSVGNALALLLASVAPTTTRAATRAITRAFTRATPPLGCRVDPAVELLSTLVLLGAPPRHRPELDYDYTREIRTRFADFASHAAVRRAATINAAGFEDFTAQLASRLGPPPALVERRQLRSVGDGPASIPADSLRALVTAARDFAQQSDFMAFFDAHAAFYRAMCDRVLADGALGTVAERTERFFGTPAGGYELVLMPLVPRLGVSPPGVRAASDVTLTAYVGPASVDTTADGATRPRFRAGWALERVVLHEFAHQHVNAAVYGAVPALRRSAAMLQPVRSRVWRADRVASWPGAVTETVVRAAVAVMRGDMADDAAARVEMREHRAFGFTLIDSVATTLRAARAAANGAPWWPDAMRDVVAQFDRIAASPRMRDVVDPTFDAGMAQALIAAAPDSVAIIVPEGDAHDATMSDSLRHALGDSVRSHVRRMRDQYFPRATLLTDRDALARDLRGWTLWAVGTLDDNAWLRAHAASVPARVDSTRIVADAEYKGRGLVFVGAVPSPVDTRHALLLTVGQRLDELARGWWVVTWDYAVMDGTRALSRGTYVIDGTRRRFAPSAEDSTQVPGRSR